LPEFWVRTVQEQGWSSLQNGELLRVAAQDFDVFVTADKNLRYQQNIAKYEIGVVVLATRDARLPSLRQVISALRESIATVAPGCVLLVPAP